MDRFYNVFLSGPSGNIVHFFLFNHCGVSHFWQSLKFKDSGWPNHYDHFSSLFYLNPRIFYPLRYLDVNSYPRNVEGWNFLFGVYSLSITEHNWYTHPGNRVIVNAKMVPDIFTRVIHFVIYFTFFLRDCRRDPMDQDPVNKCWQSRLLSCSFLDFSFSGCRLFE